MNTALQRFIEKTNSMTAKYAARKAERLFRTNRLNAILILIIMLLIWAPAALGQELYLLGGGD